MIASSYRPAGGRLLPGCDSKLKGLVIVPRTTDSNDTFWTQWPWQSWIKPQIDHAVTLGVNAVKLTGYSNAVLSGTLPQPTAATQLNQYLDYTNLLGLRVYDAGAIGPNFVSQYGYANIVSYFQWHFGLIAGRSHVVGADVCNEINAGNSPLTPQLGSELMAQLVPAIRAVAATPIAASLTLNTKAMLSDSFAQAIVPWCDFIDYHPYFNIASSTVGEILPSDITPLRSNSWWKPFIIGESGQSVTAGPLRQTATWTANGQILANLPECMGAIGFSVSDYETTFLWGVEDTSFNLRTACTTPFQAWVGRL